MMLPAVLPYLPDTALPGLTTRRFWQAPELITPGFLLLTVHRLYWSLTPKTLTSQQQQQLAYGAQVEELLGPDLHMLNLADLDGARLELESHAIQLNFSSDSPRLYFVRFQEATTADDFFAKLARRLQDRCQVIVPKPDTLQAMRSPLAAMAGVLSVMLTVMLLANTYHELVEYRFLMGEATSALPAWFAWLDAFFQTLPPRFIGSLGGVALAGLQLWAYRRLTQPPARLVLVPLDCSAQCNQ